QERVEAFLQTGMLAVELPQPGNGFFQLLIRNGNLLQPLLGESLRLSRAHGSVDSARRDRLLGAPCGSRQRADGDQHPQRTVTPVVSEGRCYAITGSCQWTGHRSPPESSADERRGFAETAGPPHWSPAPLRS